MTKYPRLGDQSVALEYLNNHIPQKVVKETLQQHGVPVEHMALIDWKKNSFPGQKFMEVYPKHLSEWPKVGPDLDDLPLVKRAVVHLLNDQGFDVTAVPTNFVLPTELDAHYVEVPSGKSGYEKIQIDWQRVEKFLATLTLDELETFCVGEPEDMVALATSDNESYDCTDMKFDGPYAYRAIEEIYMHIMNGA